MTKTAMKIIDPEVKIWQDRIERGKKLRDAKLKEVKVYLDFYNSKQWGNRVVNLGEKPTVNLIFPHINSQLPFLYFQNPKWFVRPRRKVEGVDTVKSAKQMEKFLNYYATENMGSALKRQMRFSIKDAHFFFGAMKSGYVSDFETNENFGKYTILGYDASGKEIYDIDAKTGNFKTDDREEISTNQRFISRRVSPKNFIFDTEGDTDFESGRFIIEEITKDLADVKGNKIYKNTEKLQASFDVQRSMKEKIRGHEEWNDTLKDSLKRIVLYEIYDLENKKIKVITDDCVDFLRNDELPDGVEDHPYSFLVFYSVMDEIYPLSEMKALIPIQEDFNIGRGLILDHSKRFNRKYAILASTFKDEASKLAFEKGGDGTVFEVTELPLNKVMDVVKDAPLEPSIYASFQQSKEDFREVGGATESERGLVERRKTAYEASKISEASGIRKEDKKSLVEDFAASVGKKLSQSMQANLTDEDAMLITGDEGLAWEDIKRDDIAGEFNVTIEVGSAAPKLPEFERQDYAMLIQSLSAFPQELIRMHIKLPGIIRGFARTFQTLDAEEVLNNEEEMKQIKAELDKERQIQSLIAMRGQDKPTVGEKQGGTK